MRRVCDDDICLRNILHHSPLRYFLHLASLTTLDLRISFCIFILILYFLLGHLHIIIEFNLLVCKICNTYNQINQADLQSDINDQCTNQRQRLFQ